MNKLFRCNVTKDTMIAGTAGVGMIVLSLLMLPFSGTSALDTMMHFLLRDVLMIFGLGIVFVSIYVEKKGKESKIELGFSNRKNKLSLVLNVIFAGCLLGIFLKEQVPNDFFSTSNMYAAVYIIVAGIFEMTFIYGYLRMSFEKAFGIIPAVLFTSAFYSFHHAGFQPEFLHLFWVGVMYCAVYYITQNLLIIFPFFWGVGALWDVLVSSDVGEGIKNVESFVIALLIIVLSAVWFVYRKRRRKKQCFPKHQL